MEQFKKYCKNCVYFKLEEIIIGRFDETCTYEKAPRRLFPSIDNANYNCIYYEESFTTRALRRFKNE